LQAANRDSKPVYPELPSDQLEVAGVPIPTTKTDVDASDPGAFTEAVEETLQRLTSATNAVILAGVEIHRRALQDVLARLVTISMPARIR
jgi:TPP-dependent 2-oxoacid decarboxylase